MGENAGASGSLNACTALPANRLHSTRENPSLAEMSTNHLCKQSSQSKDTASSEVWTNSDVRKRQVVIPDFSSKNSRNQRRYTVHGLENSDMNLWRARLSGAARKSVSKLERAKN